MMCAAGIPKASRSTVRESITGKCSECSSRGGSTGIGKCGESASAVDGDYRGPRNKIDDEPGDGVTA
jgi:hypothetical protein